MYYLTDTHEGSDIGGLRLRLPYFRLIIGGASTYQSKVIQCLTTQRTNYFTSRSLITVGLVQTEVYVNYPRVYNYSTQGMMLVLIMFGLLGCCLTEPTVGELFIYPKTLNGLREGETQQLRFLFVNCTFAAGFTRSISISSGESKYISRAM